jgi:hypothetical protein
MTKPLTWHDGTWHKHAKDIGKDAKDVFKT